MTISLSFSLVIYQITTVEIQRLARAQRAQLLQQLRGGGLYPDSFRYSFPTLPLLDPDVIEQTEARVVRALGLVNLFILGAAGGLGYFLAGRTLKPIKEMVDEQYRFVSDASHELRTPLTALKANLEVHMRDRELRLDQAKELIKDSVHDVERLQTLSDNMLTLARMDRKAGNSVREFVQLTELVNDATKKMGALAKQKNLEMVKQIKDTWVWGVRDELEQLLVILIDNAIKYSKESGTVKISGGTSNRNVMVEVYDNGVGIGKDEIPKIFDRFYRADKSRSGSTKDGHGLGLAIAKKIVENHRGSISVSSREGEFTKFRVILPSGKI